MKIVAKVDFELIQRMPAVDGLFLEFDCGWFRCDTLEEIIAMANELRKPSWRVATPADLGLSS